MAREVDADVAVPDADVGVEVIVVEMAVPVEVSSKDSDMMTGASLQGGEIDSF